MGPRKLVMSAPFYSEAELGALDTATLERLVRHHNHLYWDLNKPEISDTDFDRLVRQLQKVNPSSAVLDELGPKVEENDEWGTPSKHEHPMLSLDKCYSDETLTSWLASFAGDVVVTPKFDGIAAAIRYDEHGSLVLAATRGNGVVGEQITANVRSIKDIPTKIKPQGQAVEVRGEIFMRLSVFEKFKDKFSNPRNLAAGAIKQKDPKKSAAYKLSFAPYELLGTDHKSEQEKHKALVEMGLPPIEVQVVPKDKALAAYRDLAERRAKLDFEIDGVVLKALDVEEQKRLGATAHHPRYAIAYKFQGDTGTTFIRDIEWSVARTGAITPVALLDPVMLSGAMVSRTSLHHPGFIKKLGLTKNAEVLVTRRGGVIPNLEQVTKAGDEPFEIPTSCPSCGGAVHDVGDFVHCMDPSQCRSGVLGRNSHFVSVAEIEGFGDRMLGELYDRKLVRNPIDLYTLKVADLLPIDRVGKKLAEKLVREVDAHRKMPLATFLRALGIDELGKHVSKILVQEYKTLDRVLLVTTEEFEAVHSIGSTIAKTVVEGLKTERPLIDALLQHITLVEDEEDEIVQDSNESGTGTTSKKLAGMSFVFTGKMAKLDRKAAQASVKKLGGTAPDSVNKTVTYLVVGDDKSDGKKSTKEKAADKLVAAGGAIKIISESDFLLMTAEEDTSPTTGTADPTQTPAKTDDGKQGSLF
jgi:DNA ligase (NAD+)